MSTLEFDPSRDRIVQVFCSRNELRGLALLNPFHNCGKDVVAAVKWKSLSTILPNLPCSWTSRTVKHARDAEVAHKVIKFRECRVHPTSQMFKPSLGIHRCDLLVLLSVIGQDLTTSVLEGLEFSRGKCTDIEGVQLCCDCCIASCPVCRIP